MKLKAKLKWLSKGLMRKSLLACAMLMLALAGCSDKNEKGVADASAADRKFIASFLIEAKAHPMAREIALSVPYADAGVVPAGELSRDLRQIGIGGGRHIDELSASALMALSRSLDEAFVKMP